MIEYIGKTVKVIIDRPLGSKHPRFDHYYPINYGYIPNTLAGDGMEIDAYILGVDKPIKEFTGIVIAVIKRFDDVEDKLVVADSQKKHTKEKVKDLTIFQEKYFNSMIIMKQDL